MDIVSFILLAIGAEILGTIGGFGSSILFVPIAALFFDFKVVLMLTALFHVASNVSKISLFRAGVDQRIIILMGVPAIFGVVIGALLAKNLDNDRLEWWFSLFMIGVSSLMLLKPGFSIKPTSFNTIAGGSLSGGIAGLLGSGGMIRGLTLAGFNLDINTFIATSAIIDLGIDLSRSIIYYSNGFFDSAYLYLLPILVLVGYVGSWIGKKVLAGFSNTQFKKTVLYLILLTGLYTFWATTQW